MASLVVIATIGWLGILSRNLYAAPRWIEPWDKVAQQATDIIHSGGIVIGNNPSFFFYMTYALPDDGARASHRFAGLLPNIHRTGVYDPTQWLDAGRPVGTTTLLIKGLHFDIPVRANGGDRGLARSALQSSEIPNTWFTTPAQSGSSISHLRSVSSNGESKLGHTLAR